MKTEMANIYHNKGQLVYHYTSMDVLKTLIAGIEDNHFVFHGSGLQYMNDSLEFLHGFCELRRVLPALEKELNGLDDDLKISTSIDVADKDLYVKWDKEFVETLLQGNMLPFVVSTSANGDNIPMWAMYGNHGHGVSIGLDISNYYVRTKDSGGKDVLDFTKYEINSPHAFKVVQNLSLRHPAVSFYSKMIYLEYINKAKQIKNDKELGDLKVKSLYEMSVLTSALVKHHAFRFENEWRILSLATKLDDIHFKVNSKGNFSPYMNVRIPTSALRKVIIGPCCEKTYQRNILMQLLAKHGIASCKIVNSKVPYRG